MTEDLRNSNEHSFEAKFLSVATYMNLSRNIVYMRRIALPVLLGVMILLSGLNSQLIPHADAQFPSLFPPPGITGDTATQAGKGAKPQLDKKPPEIEVVTTELNQGKNVLIVKITDESYLESRQVKYINNGRIAFADLARDHENVYYALVNVTPPSSVIQIDVRDGAGNRATVVDEIPVGPPPDLNDFIDRILTFIDNIIAGISSVRI